MKKLVESLIETVHKYKEKMIFFLKNIEKFSSYVLKLRELSRFSKSIQFFENVVSIGLRHFVADN